MSGATRYPGAKWRPVRNFTAAGIVAPTRGLIPHVQEGDGSLFGWFDNAASQVSAHLWVSKTGLVEQYVSFGDRAWAQAAGNRQWISCECEGFVREDYTPAQIQRLAEIYRWGMATYRWPDQITDSPDGYGLGTHRMGGSSWGGHSCPGDLRAGRRVDILAAARGYPTSLPPSEEDDVPLSDDDVARIAAATVGRLQALAWDTTAPPRQPHVGAMLRRDYEMTGETLAAVARLETRLAAIEAELSRVGDHLGAEGALVGWTRSIGEGLTAVRAELARFTAGAGGAVDLTSVHAQLDALSARLSSLTLTVTPAGVL